MGKQEHENPSDNKVRYYQSEKGVSFISENAGNGNENSDPEKVKQYQSNTTEKKARDKWFYIRIALIIGVVAAIPLLLLGTCFLIFTGSF